MPIQLALQFDDVPVTCEVQRRYFLGKEPQFTNHIRYPAPDDPPARRVEMVKLRQAGGSEKTIAHLLGCSRGTVIKWGYAAGRKKPDSSKPNSVGCRTVPMW